ncbi:unnamed protein product [Mytilus coruscus]|uniref:THAP-type domain-containing protein n=1 Tax=Mytilus coruscus TaxID=42192 RepID=A0A6J8F1B5_MYTCO|nr:unnamed protein product [Mytilus coruscus]
MPSTCCSVPQCSNRGGHVFPKDEKLKKKWIKAIRRNSDKNKYWKPSKTSVTNTFASPSSLQRATRKTRREENKSGFDTDSDTSSEENNITEGNEELDSLDVGSEMYYTAEKIEDSESNLKNIQRATSQNPVTDSNSQTQTWPALCVEKFEDDPAGMTFYTGLQSHYDFTFVLSSLGDAADNLNYLYFRSEQLSWKEINIWPERYLVRFFSPYNFKRQFPTTRIIIDGTECPIRKPRSSIAQQSTFSTYKNRNTIKILVGATPGGLVSYVSPSYGAIAVGRFANAAV